MPVVLKFLNKIFLVPTGEGIADQLVSLLNQEINSLGDQIWRVCGGCICEAELPFVINVRESEKSRRVVEANFRWLEWKRVTNQDHQFELLSVHLNDEFPSSVFSAETVRKKCIVEWFGSMSSRQVLV